LFTTVVKTYA